MDEIQTWWVSPSEPRKTAAIAVELVSSNTTGYLTSLCKWVNVTKPHPLAFATLLVVMARSWKVWEHKQSYAGLK